MARRRSLPDVPDIPGVPEIPDVPDVPDVPELFVRAARLHKPARPLMKPLDSTINGDRIMFLAQQHLGEKYILGARAPMANANWRGPWDCAEFVSWCVYQATGILFGVEPRHDPVRADAFTGFWADQARTSNALIPVEQAAGIAGAALLRIPKSGKIGHIVLSNGKGGTVEAHSAANGVCKDTLSGRRWDFGVLVPGVRYFGSDTVVTVKPPAEVMRLTEPMTRGDRVKALQRCLNKLGYAVGATDGVFGPQTEWAIQVFQNDVGLVPDGEVGDATLDALKEKSARLPDI